VHRLFIMSCEYLANDACADGLDDAKPTGNKVSGPEEIEVATLLHHSFTG
jgi:hypothetical protein